MEILTLKSRLRTDSGKSYTRKIRNQGWIPAVYYGHDLETKHIEIDQREFAALVRARKTTRLINLNIPGEKDSTSVIKEIQKHVLKDNLFYHVDFQHVAMDKKIIVHSPIRIVGTAMGVREEGGILGHPKRTLAVECLPGDIPEYIEIDVSALNMGDSIHVRDLEIPNVVIKDSPDDVVATVVHPQVVVEETPEVSDEEAEGEEGAETKEGEEAKEGAEDKKPEDKKPEDKKSGDRSK